MMEFRKWYGEYPVWSEEYSELFGNWDEIYEFLEESNGGVEVQQKDLEKMRLRICEPVYFRELDADDYWSEDLSDDVALEPVLASMVFAINVYLRRVKPIASWRPGKYGVDLGPYETEGGMDREC